MSILVRAFQKMSKPSMARDAGVPVKMPPTSPEPSQIVKTQQGAKALPPKPVSRRK